MKLNKKITLAILAAAVTFSGNTFAGADGFLVGAQIGGSNSNLSSSDFPRINLNGAPNANVGSRTGFAGRIYGGYQFNQWFVAELGYARYATTKITNPQTGRSFNAAGYNVVDLTAKGIYTFADCIGVFAKLGAAYINNPNSAPNNSNNSGNSIRPLYGLGAQYEFTPNVTADVSWTRIQKGANLRQSADFYGVGLSYNFG